MLARARRTALSSLVVAGLVVPLTATGAHAATISESDATALSGSLAGQQGLSSGTVTATFDGGRERVNGNTTPAIPTGGLLDAGVLAQRATAGNGFARACAGLAGNGDGIVQAGDGSCLTPGDSVTASFGNATVPDLEGQLPDQLPPELTDALGGVTDGLAPVTKALEDGLAAAREQFGDAGLFAEATLVEGRCAVDGDGISGSARLAGAKVVLRFPDSTGQEDFVIADLPADPGPNTPVPTNTSKVVEAIAAAVVTNFESSLGGQGGALGDALGEQLLGQLSDAIRDNIEEQLAPIEENLLRITLNEQSVSGESIRVTALHAEVLPVAREQLDAPAGELRIGDVNCGPAGAVAGETVDPPEAPEAAAPARPRPALPTAVSAGLAGDDSDGLGAGALAVLALGSAAAGAAGWTAVRRRRDLQG